MFNNFTIKIKAIQDSAKQENTSSFIMIWIRLWQRQSCEILTATDNFKPLKEVWFALPEKNNLIPSKLCKHTAVFRSSCSSPQSRQAATRQLKMSQQGSRTNLWVHHSFCNNDINKTSATQPELHFVKAPTSKAIVEKMKPPWLKAVTISDETPLATLADASLPGKLSAMSRQKQHHHLSGI